MKSFLHSAQNIKNVLVKDRRHLHGIPEIGHDLPETTSYVKQRLLEIGYEPLELGHSGIVALAGRKKAGDKVILLRADMDALPLIEESGLPFASTNGHCHACGHDIHTAMLLGAAALLKEVDDQLEGTVKFMFQPAEEPITGAKDMLDAGVLENPKVDVAFGIHVNVEQPVGVFGYNNTYQCASSDSFQITIQGKGTHGAMPYRGVDPINVAAHIHIALQEIIAREVNAYDPLVITVGQLIAGQAMNIIPDTATMKGSIRAYSVATRDMAVRRLQEISECTARAFNATAITEILGSVPSMRCDADMVALMLEQLKSAAIEGAVFNEVKTMGSEDFAFVSNRVPSAFLSLGCAFNTGRQKFALHNPHILFDEDCMPIGAAIHAAIAKNWLSRNK